MEKPFNPPAFPCEAQGDRSVPAANDYLQTGIHSATFPGMTLRDWYIGQGLTGLLAGRGERSLRFNPEDDAEYLGRIADALLTERAKGEGK